MENKMKNVSEKKKMAVKILAGAMAVVLIVGAIAVPLMYFFS